MGLSTILWLALLLVLALLFVVTLRRMSALIARTRDLERFQRAVDSLDRRLATAVQPLVRALDDARRHAGDSTALAEQLGQAQAMLAQLQAECRSVATPPGLAGAHAALGDDLDRAARAASLVEHGLGAMANKSIGRDLEAQTSLKRGALNLRHAQEAFAQRARGVAGLRPADLVPGAAGAGAALSAAGSLAVYPGGEGEDLEGRFDPRM